MAMEAENKNESFWLGVVNSFLTWKKISRWRKASKWKKQIKQVQRHLEIQKKRKAAIIKQTRADVAQLLQHGKVHQAKIEQLYKDQKLILVYDQINDLCQCIIENMSQIMKNSNPADTLPARLHEALATLIYAASRSGELPELHILRTMIRERYGYEFDYNNMELLPGNNVNPEIRNNLCITSVPESMKLALINEISENSSHMTLCSYRRESSETLLTKIGTPHDRSNAVTETNLTKNSAWKDSSCRPDFPKSRHFRTSTEIPLSKSHYEIVRSKRFSFDGTVDNWRFQEGNCSNHVHLKLPDYEDFVAKFEDLKMMQRLDKRF